MKATTKCLNAYVIQQHSNTNLNPWIVSSRMADQKIAKRGNKKNIQCRVKLRKRNP